MRRLYHMCRRIAKSRKSWYNDPIPLIGLEGEGVLTRDRRRTRLLVLIAVELLGAAVVLWWLLSPGDNRQLVGVSVAAEIPATLTDAIRHWVTDRPGELTSAGPSIADLTVGWHRAAGAYPLVAVVLVPVAPFASLRDDVAAGELRRAWLGQPRPRDTVSHLLVSPQTAAALEPLFGPRRAEASVTVVPAAELPDRLVHISPELGGMGLVPFDRLEPRLKALSVDGLSALDRDLDLRRYPLLARVWVNGPRRWERALAAEIGEQGLATNRRLDRLTVLAMTGVTALARGVALQIEAREDYAWPARGVADLLSSADLTHVSHEVSFVPGCRVQTTTQAFCAKPEYLETLRLVGADLVELTGNHNLDFGPEYALQSLDLYAQAQMHTFGGGQDASRARQPVVIRHNGNRLAFLGYNGFGPDYAWATEDHPGAARFSLEAVQADLAEARPQADVIFVSVQYTETYSTTPLPAQVADFQAVVRAGADVVTGSQAHQPQAVEFYDGGLILYGLGNLVFDQTWSAPTRQSLIVRHLIYDGRLIVTQLIPTIMEEDCQPRPAEAAEREAILKTVFAASGW
jgi:hypothetical protein